MMDEVNEAEKLPAVIVETRSATAIVRLNRPNERNPLSVATLEELDSIISALTTRRDVHAIIFTGTGDVFASGADLRELSGLTPDAAREFAARGQRLFQKIADATQLTIAAINGYCMGGGLDLALACDVRCAAPSAVFAHPGARRGIITGWGGTQRLPRLIGTARALEMFTTAKLIDCREAYEIGLVSETGEPVIDCALELALAHRSKVRVTS
jgi:enoyl-CoA hydratase/carnithine racemase